MAVAIKGLSLTSLVYRKTKEEVWIVRKDMKLLVGVREEDAIDGWIDRYFIISREISE